MRILIACEFSGVVRDAFRTRGHDAVSCDLLPTERKGPHIQGDVLSTLKDGWDMMIAFPPCTHLAVSGAKHFPAKRKDGRQRQGIDFFLALAHAPIARKALENPVGIMSHYFRRPDQIIHPWQYGHAEQKSTCLWLEGLPTLRPMHTVRAEMMALPKRERERIHYLFPSPDRAKLRSTTFQGIADAMAFQWNLNAYSVNQTINA